MLQRVFASAFTVAATAIDCREYADAAWSDLSGSVIPVRTADNTSVWLAVSDSDDTSFIWSQGDCPPLVPRCVSSNASDSQSGTNLLQLPGFLNAERVPLKVNSRRILAAKSRTDVAGVISQRDMPRAIVRSSETGPFKISFFSANEPARTEMNSPHSLSVDETLLVQSPRVSLSLQRRNTVLGLLAAKRLVGALRGLTVIGNRIHVPCKMVVDGKLGFSLSLGIDGQSRIEIPIEATKGDGSNCPTSLYFGWHVSDIELGTDFLKNVDGVELQGLRTTRIYTRGSLVGPSATWSEPFNQSPRFLLSNLIETDESFKYVLERANSSQTGFIYTVGPDYAIPTGIQIVGMVPADKEVEIPGMAELLNYRVDAPRVNLALNGSLVIESKRNPEGEYRMSSWGKVWWADQVLLRWIPLNRVAVSV